MLIALYRSRDCSLFSSCKLLCYKFCVVKLSTKLFFFMLFKFCYVELCLKLVLQIIFLFLFYSTNKACCVQLLSYGLLFIDKELMSRSLLYTFLKFNAHTAHSQNINRFLPFLLTEIQKKKNLLLNSNFFFFTIYTSHHTQHQTFSAEQRTEWTESRTAQQCSPIWTCAGFKLYNNVLYVFGYYYGAYVPICHGWKGDSNSSGHMKIHLL